MGNLRRKSGKREKKSLQDKQVLEKENIQNQEQFFFFSTAK